MFEKRNKTMPLLIPVGFLAWKTELRLMKGDFMDSRKIPVPSEMFSINSLSFVILLPGVI